jgi:hypothetical protein
VRLAGRIRSITQDWQELSGLTGKSKEVVHQMHEQMVKDKQRYDATADEFRGTRHSVMLQGNELMNQLSRKELEHLLEEAQAQMEGRWTTSGLIRNMRDLTDQVKSRFSKAGRLSNNVKNYLNQAGERFHREHGLASIVIPPLDLTAYHYRIESLVEETEEFCRDPANLLVEKRFMIRRFYTAVVDEIHKAYLLAAKEAKRWLRIAMDPIMVRIMEHKGLLDERLNTLKKTLANMDQIKARMSELKTEAADLQKQRALLENIAARLKD